MLKSTHRSQVQDAPHGTSPAIETSLPAGWTEHVAPTGHKYYYNAETKQSTYTRPFDPSANQTPNDPTFQFHQGQGSPGPPRPGLPEDVARFFTGPVQPVPDHSTGLHRNKFGKTSENGRSRQQPTDRPKSKFKIPGHAPWLLVYTKLGRRFAHNPETGESLWKIPQEIMQGVLDFDVQHQGRPKRTGSQSQEGLERNDEAKSPSPSRTSTVEGAGAGPIVNTSPSAEIPEAGSPTGAAGDEGSSEYEEVEVTDDDEDDGDAEGRSPATGAGRGREPAKEEFTEEDMAYQLAQMGQEHELDHGEYGLNGNYEDDEEYIEGEEGLPMSEQEIEACFTDMLEDYQIDPFTTWEKTIDEGNIVEDYRYALLPNTKSRRAVFQRWSTEKVQKLKEQKQQQAKQDPKIPYLRLLHEKATPKLFWQEFRRKYKKEPEMTNIRLSDRDREKFYRDHIHRITKSSETSLKQDLEQLLKSVPPSDVWNRGTDIEGALPSLIASDIRFISLKGPVRDEILRNFIKTLPRLEDLDEQESSASALHAKADRDRRAKALSDRQKKVTELKRQQDQILQSGRSRLMQEEKQLREAMNVGRNGLKSNLNEDTQS